MAENAYMQFLNNLVQTTEDRRYGTPTERTTGELGNSMLDALIYANAGSKAGGAIGEYLDWWRKNKSGNSGNLGTVPEAVTWKV
jgi:hypothetical protein